MTPYLRVAAVITLAVIASTAAISAFGPGGSGFGPGGFGSGGSATPSPSPALLARGTFVANDGAVELEATGEGTTVTGRMTVSVEEIAFTVDLQCARTTEDGLIMIGGITTDSSARYLSPVGTRAGIVLQRGSPVEANLWYQRGGPMSEAASCLAFLEEQLTLEECCRNSENPPHWVSPIRGTVELGP